MKLTFWETNKEEMKKLRIHGIIDHHKLYAQISYCIDLYERQTDELGKQAVSIRLSDLMENMTIKECGNWLKMMKEL